jgi:hypothetical protein
MTTTKACTTLLLATLATSAASWLTVAAKRYLRSGPVTLARPKRLVYTYYLGLAGTFAG